MLTPMKMEVLIMYRKILSHQRLLEQNGMLHRLLYMSHCENTSYVEKFKEGNVEKKSKSEEESLPSLVQTPDAALVEPIKLIPAKIRHLQDTRIIYSSLFPKYYSKPMFMKVDLRDKHVLMVKDRMRRKAVDAVVALEYENSSTSKILPPKSEQAKESFPYLKDETVLVCSKNTSLTCIEKLKVNYEALPEVDRKKELAALLEAYDANGMKPVDLANPVNHRWFNKYFKPYNKILSNEEQRSCDKLMKMDTPIFPPHKPDQSAIMYSSKLPSVNVNQDDAQVCSKCQVILDLPIASETSTNIGTEKQDCVTSYKQSDQLCQRCQFDVVHSSTARVLVPPDSYLDVLRPMSTRYSMVLVVVDVMDAPISIHPNIMDVIGRGQPVIVVANKVDLLPLDAKKSLRTMWHTITEMVKSSRLASANIIDTVLVSAKTGFGMTELRTLVQGQWRDNGDVFLVGGAGCGKTSLFKALVDSIGSDEHLDLAHRVKGYNWPLTDLGLLKFEMKRVHGELQSLERSDLVERTVRPFKHLPRPVPARPTIPARPEGDSHFFAPQEPPLMLQGEDARPGEIATSEVARSEPASSGAARTSGATRTSGAIELPRQMKTGAWLYDTPSAVMPMQVLDLLTEEEIKFLTPPTKITPQSFKLKQGKSLFLAGLARIDVLYLHHPKPFEVGWSPHDNAKLTVYAAKCVPKTLVDTMDASSVYRDHLGDEVFKVPRGSEERLSQWPALAPQNFTATGPNAGVAAADIVLPSLGFVSVWLFPLTVCSLRVWTPGGRGAFLRSQSLLPYAIHLKGPSQRKGVVYDDHVPFEEKKSNWDPSAPPSPERLHDDDPMSIYVQIRHKLGYQP